MSEPCSAVMMSSVCLVSRPPRWIGTHLHARVAPDLDPPGRRGRGPRRGPSPGSARGRPARPGSAYSSKAPACSAWPSKSGAEEELADLAPRRARRPRRACAPTARCRARRSARRPGSASRSATSVGHVDEHAAGPERGRAGGELALVVAGGACRSTRSTSSACSSTACSSGITIDAVVGRRRCARRSRRAGRSAPRARRRRGSSSRQAGARSACGSSASRSRPRSVVVQKPERRQVGTSSRLVDLERRRAAVLDEARRHSAATSSRTNS